MRVKNGFNSSWMPSGYRDVKLNAAVNGHLCEIQLHLQSFYELKSGQHKVYEWARDLKVCAEIDANHLFKNLSPEITDDMIRLAEEDWYGTGFCLPELLAAGGKYLQAEELQRKVPFLVEESAGAACER